MAKTLRKQAPAIYTPKAGGDRIQGVITKAGSAAFERCRAILAALHNRTPSQVSDGDTIEFTALTVSPKRKG